MRCLVFEIVILFFNFISSFRYRRAEAKRKKTEWEIWHKDFLKRNDEARKKYGKIWLWDERG